MRYDRVMKLVTEIPWAIRPHMLEVIREVLALRVAGETLTDEEIRERIGPVAARRGVTQVGSVAVIPLQGVIMPKASLMSDISGGTSIASFRAMFREALAAEQVSSIVLDVDSPGGMVDQVPEMAAEIRAARGTKPIVAVANTDAASAAYWLASQAAELLVTPSGAVGSVGVYAAHDDLSGAMEKAGVKTTLISAGRYKVEGNPFEALGDEARAAIQGIVDEFYGMFTADVAKGRGVPVDSVRGGFGEGRMVTAKGAVASGMADEIGTIETAIRQAAKMATGEARTLASTMTVSLATGTSTHRSTLHAGAIPSHDTPVVDTPWDAGREEAAIPNDAGRDVLRQMYGWVDPDKEDDAKSSYKFPHHNVESGKPGPANVNGVRNGLSRLPQANIPDADRSGVEAHLRSHLDRFDKENALVPGAERLLARAGVREVVRPH